MVVRARRRDHDPDDGADGAALAVAARRAGDARAACAWLTRAYFVAYTAGQILPTSIGGDAVRIFETSRRHPARLGAISAIVLLERALGGAATVLLGAVGFVLAVGRYDVGAYLWLEGVFVFGTIVLAFVFFSRAARPLLRRWTSAAPPAAARAAPARALRGRPRLPRPPAPARRGLRAHGRGPGRPHARDLGDGALGRDRALAADLLRDGPAVLPRPARPVHARTASPCARRSSSASSAASASTPTRRSRPASSSSSSRRAGASRRRDPPLGGPARPARPQPTHAADVDASSSSPTTRCRGSSSASRACADDETVVVDNGSTDGTVDVVRERFPGGACPRAGEPRPRGRAGTRASRPRPAATS